MDERGRGCECFGVVPNRITSHWVLRFPRLWYFYPIVHEFPRHVYVAGQYLNKINLALRYQRLSFPRIYFLPRPQLPFLKNKVKESLLSLCWRSDYRSVALSSIHWLRSFEWPNMFPRNYPGFKFQTLGDSELDPCSCCPWKLSLNSTAPDGDFGTADMMN